MSSVDGPTPIHIHTSSSRWTQWVLRLDRKKKLGEKRGKFRGTEENVG